MSEIVRIPWPVFDRRRALTVVAVAALLFALFPSVFLSGGVFFERDVLIVWVAQVESFVKSVHAGGWPVWDPGVAFGHPMLANPNTQVFYPFTWLNLLFRPLTLYVLYVLAHLALAAAGFHLWARRLGLSPAAALLGACVWMASGPLLSFVSVWHHLAGAAWLPWALWAADHAFGEGPRWHAIGLPVILAIQIYAGSPDMCVFTGLVLGADAVRRAALGPRRWRPLVMLLAAYTLAVGLGAAQLAPSLDLVLHSGSRPLPLEARTLWSLHPAALVQTLVPLSFKEVPPLAPDLVVPLSDLWAPFMKSNYLGLAALLLVGWALFAAERRIAFFLGFLLAASLSVALGRYAPVHEWLSSLIPPLALVRYPSKAAVVTALAWAMLAGLGYDAWRRGMERSRAGLHLAFGALIVLFAIVLAANAMGVSVFPGTIRLAGTGPSWNTLVVLARSNVIVAAVAAVLVALLCASANRPAAWRAGLVPLLVVADLAFSNRLINPTGDSALLNQRPEILSATPADQRVYVWDYTLRAPGRGHPTAGMLAVFMEVLTLPDPSLGSLALQAYLYPPSAARWGLRGSFDRDLLSLHPPWMNEMNLFLRAVEDTPAYTQLLQLGGVGRVVALHRDIAALPLRTEIPGIFRRSIQVFDVPDPWPRTYVVCHTRTPPAAKSLETLLAPDFDPNLEVVVDREVTLQGACRQGVSRIVEDRPDRVTIEATLDGAGVVTLLDGAADGWTVSIDGVPVQILRVNHIFRGAQVERGTHRVSFVYWPSTLSMGLWISALTALAMLAAAWRTSRG